MDFFMLKTFVSSAADPDLFYFGLPDPGSKISAKFMEKLHKTQPKSQEYHNFTL